MECVQIISMVIHASDEEDAYRLPRVHVLAFDGTWVGAVACELAHDVQDGGMACVRGHDVDAHELVKSQPFGDGEQRVHEVVHGWACDVHDVEGAWVVHDVEETCDVQVLEVES